MDRYCADNSGFGPVQLRYAESARPGGNAFHLQSFVTLEPELLRSAPKDITILPCHRQCTSHTGTAILLACRWLSDRVRASFLARSDAPPGLKSTLGNKADTKSAHFSCSFPLMRSARFDGFFGEEKPPTHSPFLASRPRRASTCIRVLEFTGTVKVIPARFGSKFSITIGKVPAWMKRAIR
jgi:hypothetical protein